MKRIYLRLLLLLAYLITLGYLLYPTGTPSLLEGAGLRWLLTMGASLLVLLLLAAVLLYRHHRQHQTTYGYYDQAPQAREHTPPTTPPQGEPSNEDLKP